MATLAEPATKPRIEYDSMGKIEAPANVYWEAQTEYSLLHFGDRARHDASGAGPGIRLPQESLRAGESIGELSDFIIPGTAELLLRKSVGPKLTFSTATGEARL